MKIHQASLFEHPVFREAVADLAILGVEVKPYPCPGAKPYAVVGGRSNARWWLVPLDSGRITASGLALFQPLLTSARIMKSIAITLSRLGLSGLWVRQRVYLSGESALRCHFPSAEALTFAYFTGTDSPHRKAAVQIMDRNGTLKGFAKVTRNPNVRELLKHEAATLEQVQKLGLQSAYTPKVIFSGERNGSFILVTDTLKTRRASTKTEFSVAHNTFIHELAQKTTATEPILVCDIAAHFQARLSLVRHNLDQAWQQRLEKAINSLQSQANIPLTTSLSHGDFTPWNTFFVDGKLYIFDWEYTEIKYPLSFDLIHFLLGEPCLKKRPVAKKIKHLVKKIKTNFSSISEIQAMIHITVYLIAISLRYIERSETSKNFTTTWDSAKDYAELLEVAAATATGLPTNP